MADLPKNGNDISLSSGVSSPLKDFQISNDSKSKSDKKFGEKIVLQCEQIINSSYFTERNKRFDINEQMAEGRMNTDQFKDFMNINGKTNYVNLNWSPIKTPNTIISRMVQRWMQKKEKAVVEAVDPVSTKQKKEKVDQAEFLLYNKELLQQLQEQSGVQMIPQDEFIPDDKDDLDLWAREELRTPEEILYEKGINTVLEENGFASGGLNARRIRWDSSVLGLIGAEVYADRNGKIHVDYHSGKNCFYSYSAKEDLGDSSIRGVVVSYKIADIKEKYPNLSVEELFEIAKYSKDWKTNNNITFDNGWNRYDSLPFDEWNVDCVKFALESVDIDKSLIKKARDGSMYVDKPKKRIEDVYEGNEYVEKKIWNIYYGVYVRSSKKILEWGLQKNMIRPQDYNNICKVYSPFVFFMYQNNRMRNLAIPEKIEAPIEGMQLCLLRIQQFVAKMRPSGYMYDVDGLQEMDLGNGVCTPLELQRITDQTGNVYYRSKDAEGNRLDKPITENPNAAGASQLQELIALYNFHFEAMRNEIGSNEQAEGQTAKPRVGIQNVQTSLEISFNASDHINDACISLTGMISERVACLLHDSVEFGAEEYRDILQEQDVKERAFNVRIEILPQTDELTEFDNTINVAMQSNPALVMYMNPSKIKRVARENLKLADAYYRQSLKRAYKGEMTKSQQQSTMNAEIQKNAGIAIEKEKQNSLAAELNVKGQLAGMESQTKEKQALITMFTSIYDKGMQIPESWKEIETALAQNIGMALMASNQQTAQALEQQQGGDEEEEYDDSLEQRERQEVQEQTAQEEMQEQPM